MTETIRFPEIDCYGGCPKCGRHDGYLNVGREHWFKCDKHKTKWPGGENLFSEWKYEPESLHRENLFLLATYAEVEPVYPATVTTCCYCGTRMHVEEARVCPALSAEAVVCLKCHGKIEERR